MPSHIPFPSTGSSIRSQISQKWLYKFTCPQRGSYTAFSYSTSGYITSEVMDSDESRGPPRKRLRSAQPTRRGRSRGARGDSVNPNTARKESDELDQQPKERQAHEPESSVDPRALPIPAALERYKAWKGKKLKCTRALIVYLLTMTSGKKKPGHSTMNFASFAGRPRVSRTASLARGRITSLAGPRRALTLSLRAIVASFAKCACTGTGTKIPLS